MWRRLEIWMLSWRLSRCQRLLDRQWKGLPVSGAAERFIESLYSMDLKDKREAEANRRWRKDAILTLEEEIDRLRQLLTPPVEKERQGHL